ncbi:hypothetical protein GH5_00162 [Leishmania sp. Ghana 2012 LV757]|uniref:hypothetical protein n=1 Tax=Leishmania sp. Ghana 2012 LV757 TaxID=2803181 RepID=UPI001B753AF0|nr:hypothetical protein GH5_00162 [Leishmania sp. Ghana 2012 LV757]
MAKRTVGMSAMRGVASSETSVRDASLRRPSADEKEAFQSDPVVALDVDREVISTKASPEEAPGAPLSWPFLCPLCSAVELVDPVHLHAPVRDTVSPCSLHSEPVDEAFHCLACRVCVEHWLSAARAVKENKVEATDGAGVTNGTATAVTYLPSSAAASSCVPLLACPLCSAACDAAILSRLDSIGSAAAALNAHVVRNICTGSQYPLSNTTIGDTVGSPSAPTALASSFCSVCEEERATCACVQCDFGMCDACHKATHTKGGFRQHEVMGLEQARRRGHLRCTEHAGMALDLFCDTCSTCVCVTCCFGGAHRGHDVSPLADVVARTAAALTQRAAELTALQRDADATHTRFAALWPAYETKVDSVRTEIQQCFASLRQVLHEREDALLAQLNEVSSEVGSRSSELRNAMNAVSHLLGGSGECLRSLPGSVSPATLMRVFDTVQRQQEWVSRVSARVLKEATAFAEGWCYNMGSDGANGCRMASFVLLNATTPNDDGLRQYECVLSDLGRLDASADVQLRVAERPSMTSLEMGEGRGERVEEKDEPSRWGGIADDFTVSSNELRNGTPVDCGREGYSTSGVVAIVEEGKEEELARPSHIVTATPPLPPPAAPSKSREVSVASRDVELCASRQRSMSASAVQSQFRPPRVSSFTAAQQSTYWSLRTYELNVGFSGKGASAVTSSSAAATNAAGTARLHGATSRWSDSKQERREVGGRGDFVGKLGLVRCRTVECAEEARGVRETMPFWVSLSPRRIESYDRTEDNGRSTRQEDDQMPWRAFKLQRHSSVTGDIRSAVTSLPRHGSSSRLQYLTELELRKPDEIALAAHDSSVSATKLLRAESQRRTAGLQLEF